jgi:hypothetical protein
MFTLFSTRYIPADIFQRHELEKIIIIWDFNIIVLTQYIKMSIKLLQICLLRLFQRFAGIPAVTSAPNALNEQDSGSGIKS